jgi:protein involved in polysaccharide export with SLBB domain
MLWSLIGSLMSAGTPAWAQTASGVAKLPQQLGQSSSAVPAAPEPAAGTFTFAGRSFPAMQALSKPIDPARYLVGPGDGLQIQIWGGVDLLYEVVVTAEGKIVIPTIGTLEVKGKPLKEIQELIAREAVRYYRGANAAVTLAVLRSFEVFVLGEVRKPGIHPATLVTRVTELLDAAGGVAPSGSIRRIELRRDDQKEGAARLVDVSRFLFDGVLDENPYVSDGMTVFVPLNKGTAMIMGAVERPGTYTLREGDTVDALIAAAGGLRADADPEQISLSRGLPPQAAVPPDGIDRRGAQARHMALQDGDQITIPAKDGTIAPIPVVEEQVYVVGNVDEPGPYPYLRNRSVSDYIGLAGGGDTRAAMARTVVKRRHEQLDAKMVTAVQPGDMIVVPETRLKWWQDYVAIITAVSTVVLSALAVAFAAGH